MSNQVYLNGQWVEKSQAMVNVEDRGFMFADGVYEVVRYYNGRPVAMARHVERMAHSLQAIRIRLPDNPPAFDEISDQLVRRNAMPDCYVYWQVTRGVAMRNHKFPLPPVAPTVLAIAYHAAAFDPAMPTPRLKAVTRSDDRWMRCEIKAVSLLANVLARQDAADAGCDEAILIRDDVVTEATARSVLIVEGDTITTHPLDGRILDSITRQIVLDEARAAGYRVVEAYYPPSRLRTAHEVIAVGTTTEVAAVIELDAEPVADGQPGRVANDLFRRYRRYVAHECGLEPSTAGRM